VRNYPTEVINEQIASPKSIRLAQNALRGVVERGTAKSLLNDKYTVAAKTGTAQIAMGRHGYQTADGSRHYLGSIAGYFPADKPRYSMIICFKTFYRPGSGKIYYGGALASPLFRTIADRIYGSSFHFLKPVSSVGAVDLTRGAKGRSAMGEMMARDSLGVPAVGGLDVRSALLALEREGYKVYFSGHGLVKAYALDSIDRKKITLILK
ncbi:MAG: penicillin-binding transpeptidase domain-containing protein, partial [Mucinivorans sp.]